MEILSGAEIVVRILQEKETPFVAGIPGGANLPIYAALEKSGIRHILSRHEQGAGFIAQGYARVSGKAGVCMASSGPGVTNLITAIADAKADSIPLVAITGQVPTTLIGTDAFQEVDAFGLSVPITKHTFSVTAIEDLERSLREAFQIAESGRPGPVLVDIPKDIQNARIVFQGKEQNNISDPAEISESTIDKIILELEQSERPILYVGGGCQSERASELVKKLAERNSIPVVSSFLGLGVFPSRHPLSLGMLGMHAAPYTNLVMEECDLLIGLGVRFDDRATGKLEEFCKEAKIIHVDIDPKEIGKLKRADIGVVSDVSEFLSNLLPRIIVQNRATWIGEIQKKRIKHPVLENELEDFVRPLDLIRQLADIASEDTIITTDVGQHQMWVAQAYPFQSPKTLITSGGFGTMGFGLPAAIGCALAKPEQTVLCISGDGSILMNLQELATLAELNLNVKVIILNNQHLGLVRQQQELFYDKKIFASKFGNQTNYEKLGQAFGISARRSDGKNCRSVLPEILNARGPGILEILIPEQENVFPIVPPGKGNKEMILHG